MKINNSHKGQKILILGLGVNQGGLGATKFFARQGDLVRVTDLKTADQLETSLNQLKQFPDIEYVLGGHQTADIDWADLIIRNPAIKPDNNFLLYAQKMGKRVEMDMGIFLECVEPEQLIGITGTKGKSTTASLIYEVLKQAGKKVILAGNIRASVLEMLSKIKPDTSVVLELSSFQLQAFEQHKISPHIAVITNIFPDHLNYHDTMENYITAKRAIAKYQTEDDFLFINAEDKITNQPKFLKSLSGTIKKFSSANLPKTFRPVLPSQHNLANMAAALAVTQQLGIPPIQALSIMQKFPGIDFRLQFIKEVNGIKIYNDSASTNPESTIQALQTLPNSILICGGMNKGLGYIEMAEAIQKYAKAVYFLEGDATDQILSLNTKYQIPNTNPHPYNKLEVLLNEVLSNSRPGDTILFSPGATSFNLFQNEFDRGEKFNQAVKTALKKYY